MIFQEFDLKTGQNLQEFDPKSGSLQPKQKEAENCYLEHWLSHHNIEEAQFYVGKFYEGVTPSDQKRLEDEGKILVFTNGRDGYFADPTTAQLMVAGDRDLGINPIYAADRNAAHNVVAYGSLISSDGIAATEIQQARILIIDDDDRMGKNPYSTDRETLRALLNEDMNY